MHLVLVLTDFWESWGAVNTSDQTSISIDNALNLQTVVALGIDVNIFKGKEEQVDLYFGLVT